MSEAARSKTDHLRLVTGGPDRKIDVSRSDAGHFLQSVLDSSPDCIKIVDLDGRLSFMNYNGCNAMQVDDFQAINGAMWHDLWPESSRGDVIESVSAARKGEKSSFQAFCPTAKGTPKWWDVSVAPVKNETGDIIAIVSISRDVTNRVHDENRIRLHELELQNLTMEQAAELREKEHDLETKDIMLREIDHRMKNSLAMLASLLRSDSRSSNDAASREKLSVAAGRVASIASVHEQLYLTESDKSGDGERRLKTNVYLTALCQDLLATMDADNVEIETEFDDVELSSGDAVTVGMVVSELAMNAVRHGGREDGHCKIRVELNSDRKSGQKILCVTDEGCGLPDGFAPQKSKGLGMKVILASAQKLDGTLSFGRREDGAGSFFKLAF